MEATVEQKSKVCIKCFIEYPIEFYYKQTYRQNRLNVCKICRIKMQDIWIKKNYQKHCGYFKKYHDSDKGKKTLLDWQLKHTYNISLEEYSRLCISQNYKCAICKTKPEKRLFVDHDHKTGKIRGLLCNNCNCALGFIKDNIQLLKEIELYLGQ